MFIPISSTLKASVCFTPGTLCFEVVAYLYLPCDASGRLHEEISSTGVQAFDEQLYTFWGDRGSADYSEYRYRQRTFIAQEYDTSLAAAHQSVIETIESIAKSIRDSATARKLFDEALKRLTRTERR